MALIKNKLFKKIFTSVTSNATEISQYNPIEYPYIGMGNPDSDVLFVGSEKAFDANVSTEIDKNERVLNFHHWADIVKNHNKIGDHLHPKLKLRNSVLKGFNPFSPLSFEETPLDVYSATHTYKKIEKIINSRITLFNKASVTSDIFEVTPKKFSNSTFNYCFHTDLSDVPKKRQNYGVSFDFEKYKDSARYLHIVNGNLGRFYKSFKFIVIYAGKDYCGNINSTQRSELIQMFNPNIDPIADYLRGYQADIYQSQKDGAKIIICKQLTSREFNIDYSLTHELAIMDIGN